MQLTRRSLLKLIGVTVAAASLPTLPPLNKARAPIAFRQFLDDQGNLYREARAARVLPVGSWVVFGDDDVTVSPLARDSHGAIGLVAAQNGRQVWVLVSGVFGDACCSYAWV